jgi:hypothetical protein
MTLEDKSNSHMRGGSGFRDMSTAVAGPVSLDDEGLFSPSIMYNTCQIERQGGGGYISERRMETRDLEEKRSNPLLVPSKIKLCRMV